MRTNNNGRGNLKIRKNRERERERFGNSRQGILTQGEGSVQLASS
jgi:hypothetical protein